LFSKGCKKFEHLFFPFPPSVFCCFRSYLMPSFQIEPNIFFIHESRSIPPPLATGPPCFFVKVLTAGRRFLFCPDFTLLTLCSFLPSVTPISFSVSARCAISRSFSCYPEVRLFRGFWTLFVHVLHPSSLSPPFFLPFSIYIPFFFRLSGPQSFYFLQLLSRGVCCSCG